jgi:hypothetical protein
MLVTLSRHSVGRIVLHVIVMLRDGEVRWHCSGIARELWS